MKNKSPKKSKFFDGGGENIWESHGSYLESNIYSQKLMLDLLSAWIWMWIIPFIINKTDWLNCLKITVASKKFYS